VVRASDLQQRRRWLIGRSASRNDSGQVFVHHNMPLFTKQYKLVPDIDWEGNRIGLASHWSSHTQWYIHLRA